MPPPDPTSASASAPTPAAAATTGAPAATPAAPGKFRRLPGRQTLLRFRSQGFVYLYLADTYLLQMEVLRLRESYMKFAYRDIQALEIRRTARGLAYNIILAVILALFAVGAVATGEVEGRWVLGGFGAFFAILLLVNVLRGPTCRCVLQTATGKHRLQTLARMRPARRALRMISERVAAVQGELDQGDAAQQMEDFLLRRAVRMRAQGQTAGGAAASPVSNASPAAAGVAGTPEQF